MKKILLSISFFIALGLYLTSLAPSVEPVVYIIPSILGGLFPVLILANAFSLVGWLIKKSGWFLLPLFAFMITWSATKKHIGFECFPKKSKAEQISVGTFNLFGLKKVNLNPTLSTQFQGEMHEAKLDVICLQESNPFAQSQLDTFVHSSYPNHYAFAGLQVLSKFPILDKGVFDFGSGVNGALWTDLEVSNKSVRIYCAHFRSNMVSSKTDDLIEKGNLTQRKTWKGVRDVLRRYKDAALIRIEQARKVKSHVNRSPHPVILCGDFNDHPLSPTLAELSDGLTDSFEAVGCGWGTTYGGSLPLLRIDYILTDSTISPIHHRVLNSQVSDHHWVRCQLALSE